MEAGESCFNTLMLPEFTHFMNIFLRRVLCSKNLTEKSDKKRVTKNTEARVFVYR